MSDGVGAAHVRMRTARRSERAYGVTEQQYCSVVTGALSAAGGACCSALQTALQSQKLQLQLCLRSAARAGSTLVASTAERDD